MSGPGFDHLAIAEGQTVHCERAAFFAYGGIPIRAVQRVKLGFQIGFGMVAGGVCAVGFIALISKAIGALFA